MPHLRVHQLLPITNGQGSNGEWRKQEVIFETLESNYPKKICIAFWNDKATEAQNLYHGEVAEVEYNVESREHNGHWYTEVKAWKLVRANQPQTQPYSTIQQPYTPPQQQPPVDQWRRQQQQFEQPAMSAKEIAQQKSQQQAQQNTNQSDDLPF